MKSLYREEDQRYTDEAMKLDIEAAKLLQPLFKRMVSEGYSAREISHLLLGVVMSIELEVVL